MTLFDGRTVLIADAVTNTVMAVLGTFAFLSGGLIGEALELTQYQTTVIAIGLGSWLGLSSGLQQRIHHIIYQLLIEREMMREFEEMMR